MISLFFTRGISLSQWRDTGNLSRELGIYKRLAEDLNSPVAFVTYGNAADGHILSEKERLGPVLWNRFRLPTALYSFLAPFLHWRVLKRTSVFRTNQMDGAWAGVVARFLFRKPLIVRCGYEWYRFAKGHGRGAVYCGIVRFIEKIVYRSADAIILTSASDAAYVVDTFGVSKKKITVIPNYIDTGLFCPNEKKQRAGIAVVARLSEQKNLHMLLDAVDGMPVQVDMYGDGPLRKQLEAHAARLPNAQVTFHGNVPNETLPDIFNSHSLFVLPSLFEGNPKALLEAMSCGISVIGTDVDGIRELIVHEQNGLLCALNKDALRAAIERLLEDGAFRERLGRGARKTIENQFSLDSVVEKEVQVYNTLVT